MITNSDFERYTSMKEYMMSHDLFLWIGLTLLVLAVVIFWDRIESWIEKEDDDD